MSHPSSQTQSHGKPMFMRTLMDMPDPALRQTCLRGPNETGLSQAAIDMMAMVAKTRGDGHYNHGEWAQARDAYMEAAVFLTSDPKFHTTVMLNCAAANLKLKNWEEVLGSTSEVLEADPKSVKALFRSARALNELGEFEEALDCCNRALELEPHNQPLRQERQTAERGLGKVKKPVLSILREAYEYYHLRVAKDQGRSALPIQPTFLPYFDPPTPDDFKTVPLLCSICLLYIERHATDKISDFPSNVPFNRLVDVLLPGPSGSASAPAALQSSPETRLTRVRVPASPNEVSCDQVSLGHPTHWDPKYEFRPSKLLMFAKMHDGESIYIEPGMTLTNVFEEAMKLKIEYPDEEKFYIEIREGMIPIYVFRKDSLAGERWQDNDYENLSDLVDPEYQIAEEEMELAFPRARFFCCGPLMRAVNLPNSASYAAREEILKGA
ncbi:hypothetical protein FS749_001574 [Ceratobasidium sp. UAMH 11750]|nr:hypothetical protein FS749_001574 [Ceratobasidium sp. UAMH 11750]